MVRGFWFPFSQVREQVPFALEISENVIRLSAPVMGVPTQFPRWRFPQPLLQT